MAKPIKSTETLLFVRILFPYLFLPNLNRFPVFHVWGSIPPKKKRREKERKGRDLYIELDRDICGFCLVLRVKLRERI